MTGTSLACKDSTTRQQLTDEQATIAKLGALQAVTFTRVGPGGANVYKVVFEKGALGWRIWLNLDGLVDSLTR